MFFDSNSQYLISKTKNALFLKAFFISVKP
jgi:hypothetical protein